MRKIRATCFATFVALAVCLGCGAPSLPAPRDTKHGGIVTFGPNLTETVFALGQGDRIVGITSFCDYPPEALSKERLGGYLDPNLERIAVLRPSLLILPGRHEKLSELAKQYNIPILNAHMDNMESIHTSIVNIGEALECPDKATALWNSITVQLDTIREKVGGKPRPKVLLINTRTNHDLNNLFSVGKSSFLAELTDVAGGENIFNDVNDPYFEASKETIVMRAPDVIVEFHSGEPLTPEQQAEFVADWNELPSLPAVQNKRVYLFMESYGLRPGPRIALTARKLAEMLHPGIELPAP
ncbi:MAG: helical backbone metal receptor [Candidatus Hydrogenedentes bacterium]|nr:helical backbone metal receptor [Candidatus Hydrogenedentota bacterium]